MKRLPRRGDDRGASLILALLVTFVIAIVTGVMLTETDTSIRTTRALRDQGSTVFNADGAAQIAINNLRKAGWTDNGASCNLSLPNFYPAGPTSPAGSAYVACAGESSSGPGGLAGIGIKPAQAVLTVTSQLYKTGNSAVKAINIGGNIVAGTSFTVASGSAQPFAVTSTSPTIIAGTSCLNQGSSTVTPACAVNAASAAAAVTAAQDLTKYPLPTAAVSPAPAPVCQSFGSGNAARKIASFGPGYYNDANLFNNAGCGQSDILWFRPGTYYFDFCGLGTGAGYVGGCTATAWTPTLPSGTKAKNVQIIAGTPLDTTGAVISMPANPTAAQLGPLLAVHGADGSCVSPISNSSAIGVQWAFAGKSQLDISGDETDLEVCASSVTGKVPIAIYGITANLTNGGTKTANAQVTCATATCAMITNDGPKAQYIMTQGMVFAPRGYIYLDLDNHNAGQPHNGTNLLLGLVANGLEMYKTKGVQGPLDDTIDLPDGFQTSVPNVADLSVYVCPGAATCDASDPNRLALRVRVKFTDVAGSRQITVLSWSEQR